MILNDLVSSLHQELELEQFAVALIHKFVNYQIFVDKMQTTLEDHKKRL